MNNEFWTFTFGRLTWAAIPYYEPILIGTFAVVAIVGLVVVGLLLKYKLVGYLWHEWLTSVIARKSASCIWCWVWSCWCAALQMR